MVVKLRLKLNRNGELLRFLILERSTSLPILGSSECGSWHVEATAERLNSTQIPKVSLL